MPENVEFDVLREEAACVRTLVRFVGCLDRREYDALLDLVTPDCVWASNTTNVGHKEIRARLDARPADMTTFHLLANIEVDFADEATATARSSIVIHRYDGLPAGAEPMAMLHPKALARCVDSLIRTSTGWKISERRMTVVAERRD